MDENNFDVLKIVGKQSDKFNLHKVQLKFDNQRKFVVKKIEELPIAHHHKETLLKLAINRKIVDITKVMKSTNNTLTLHGKINSSRSEFLEITKSDDAVIKIKLDGDFSSCDMIAYSRRLKNEEKKGTGTFMSTCFDLDKDFTSERLVMLREKNVVIIKMLTNAKTLKQMVEEYPSKLSEMYKEILTLTWNLRYLDPRIYAEKLDSLKKSIYYNEKWHLISSPDNYDHDKKSYAGENILKIIKCFQLKGLNSSELEKIFRDIYETPVFTCNYRLYTFVMEECFMNLNDKKFPRGYVKGSFPKSTKRRMRANKN